MESIRINRCQSFALCTALSTVHGLVDRLDDSWRVLEQESHALLECQGDQVVRGGPQWFFTALGHGNQGGGACGTQFRSLLFRLQEFLNTAWSIPTDLSAILIPKLEAQGILHVPGWISCSRLVDWYNSLENDSGFACFHGLWVMQQFLEAKDLADLEMTFLGLLSSRDLHRDSVFSRVDDQSILDAIDRVRTARIDIGIGLHMTRSHLGHFDIGEGISWMSIMFSRSFRQDCLSSAWICNLGEWTDTVIATRSCSSLGHLVVELASSLMLGNVFGTKQTLISSLVDEVKKSTHQTSVSFSQLASLMLIMERSIPLDNKSLPWKDSLLTSWLRWGHALASSEENGKTWYCLFLILEVLSALDPKVTVKIDLGPSLSQLQKALLDIESQLHAVYSEYLWNNDRSTNRKTNRWIRSWWLRSLNQSRTVDDVAFCLESFERHCDQEMFLPEWQMNRSQWLDQYFGCFASTESNLVMKSGLLSFQNGIEPRAFASLWNDLGSSRDFLSWRRRVIASQTVRDLIECMVSLESFLEVSSTHPFWSQNRWIWGQYLRCCTSEQEFALCLIDFEAYIDLMAMANAWKMRRQTWQSSMFEFIESDTRAQSFGLKLALHDLIAFVSRDCLDNSDYRDEIVNMFSGFNDNGIVEFFFKWLANPSENQVWQAHVLSCFDLAALCLKIEKTIRVDLDSLEFVWWNRKKLSWSNSLRKISRNQALPNGFNVCMNLLALLKINLYSSNDQRTYEWAQGHLDWDEQCRVPIHSPCNTLLGGLYQIQDSFLSFPSFGHSFGLYKSHGNQLQDVSLFIQDLVRTCKSIPSEAFGFRWDNVKPLFHLACLCELQSCFLSHQDSTNFQHSFQSLLPLVSLRNLVLVSCSCFSLSLLQEFSSETLERDSADRFARFVAKASKSLSTENFVEDWMNFRDLWLSACLSLRQIEDKCDSKAIKFWQACSVLRAMLTFLNPRSFHSSLQIHEPILQSVLKQLKSFAISPLTKKVLSLYRLKTEEIGYMTAGHVIVPADELSFFESSNQDPLYGEILFSGVFDILDVLHLNVFNANSFADLGTGLGKIPLLVFLSFPHIKDIYAVELSKSRLVVGIDALKRCDDSNVKENESGAVLEQNDRRLVLEHRDLFDVDESIFSYDIVFLQTHFKPDQYPRLLQFLQRFKSGCRLLTYENLELDVQSIGVEQVGINRLEQDRFPTSWSPVKGHHFFLYIKQ